MTPGPGCGRGCWGLFLGIGNQFNSTCLVKLECFLTWPTGAGSMRRSMRPKQVNWTVVLPKYGRLLTSLTPHEFLTQDVVKPTRFFAPMLIFYDAHFKESVVFHARKRASAIIKGIGTKIAGVDPSGL